MKDSEAEAVLLALGAPSLNWGRHFIFPDRDEYQYWAWPWPEQYCVGKTKHLFGEEFLDPAIRDSFKHRMEHWLFWIPIQVFLMTRDDWRWIYRCHFASFNDGADIHDKHRFYKTSTEARAACERHHATGKWE